MSHALEHAVPPDERVLSPSWMDLDVTRNVDPLPRCLLDDGVEVPAVQLDEWGGSTSQLEGVHHATGSAEHRHWMTSSGGPPGSSG